MLYFIKKLIKKTFWLIIFAVCGVVISLMGAYLYLGSQLPAISNLTDYKVQTPLRIYSQDGLLIAEFGEQRSLPVTYSQIPPLFIDALLAAEDDGFYEHYGVNLTSIGRATLEIIKTGRIQSGGSTITMQVAKNYLLSSERSFVRKAKEILLSFQIERELSKEQILELYINKIYLGNRAYGIAAAAEVYYGKTLEQLSVAESAMIAGLPKAPSSFNPLVNPSRSLERRNWILKRMLKLGKIDENQYQVALDTPENARYYHTPIELEAPYVAEAARQEVFAKYGDDAYTMGLDVITSIDSVMQLTANKAVLNGLIAYDKRHGFRKPLNFSPDLWALILSDTPSIANFEPVIVNSVGVHDFGAFKKDQTQIKVSFASMQWAKPYVNANYFGRTPQKPSDVVKVGDLVYVIQNDDKSYHLGQIPAVQSALLTLKPQTGAILAMIGGLNFAQSKYNRALQAKRQTGSIFKPFVYSAAIDKGYTAASMINDAPLVEENPNSKGKDWRPRNVTDNFLGPMRLREALYRSRNLVSIRLLNEMGIDYARQYLTRFGFKLEDLPNTLSLALGAGSLTPLEMSVGFSVFANGGYKANPYLVQQIKERDGKTLWQREEQATELVLDPRTAFIMTNILQDVINRGTAFRAKQLQRSDLAGKTGTTNDSKDTWFVGYNTAYVTTVWVGFDQPASLGNNEFGANLALPIWMEYMGQVLKDLPPHNQKIPLKISRLRVNYDTGRLADKYDEDSYLEYFKAEVTPETAINSEFNHEDPIDIQDLNSIF